MPAPAQSYLTTIETRTGLTPRQLLDRIDAAGLGGPDTKAGDIVAWLKAEYGLGHGHAATMAQVSRHRASVDLRNAGTTPPPPGSIGRLWLDGKDSLPA
ncbi:hypothetical protein Ani05nite_22020 [Amorphoplanes nipponensis]|uniref:DUF4287 domain-containing protein n=1 Tax=Actinoplanes nipponensis TaxID=135950 RepID=A0A919JF77_9ACTN|nr:DUF4287 domain-containing protein [Actinoplanes nipponensis]GIE48668.1 hypothetical protein Ani05nite_22020 [Actinoplanes nipponensis]